jgi:hypothetical protein
MLQIAWVEVGPCGVILTLHGQPALLRQYDPKEILAGLSCVHQCGEETVKAFFWCTSPMHYDCFAITAGSRSEG